MSVTSEPLAAFSPTTRAWFAGAFEAPTPAQVGAWDAIARGDHALVVAPTGSGKTLAAFLWALDQVASAPVPPAERRGQVLYVSPLKALASDVERNLRAPLVGIARAAERLGLPAVDVTVGVRTGDTPPAERRRLVTHPPDVLITTPESLFLVLTSSARSALAGVTTVILDEVHAVAGTKRGAHLAVSLERLDDLLEAGPGPAQRIGLSATVRPVETVAAFLGGARPVADGGRPVTVVQPPSSKVIEVEVAVPVPDLQDLPGSEGPEPGPTAAVRRASVWPHVEERVTTLIEENTATLVFTNSRRTAERMSARLNEVAYVRRGGAIESGTPAALVPGQSGTANATDPEQVIARAHHGSMSRAARTATEDELKAGLLPAVVATSSLELGIDMGAVDLVVQVGAPPSVASGLQRVGRAGHAVGAVSRGVILPMHRSEIALCAVVAERMRAGRIEAITVPANPLDVLAQHVVAMLAVEDLAVDRLAAVVRRAAPFTDLGDASLRAVLDLLAGRHQAEALAEARPRIVWDRERDVLSARPGALRLAATSGGTIPDRGLFGVFLVGEGPGDPEARGKGGRRVGELDEEMVYESRVGDLLTLGSSTWRVEEITRDRVLVSPAPGAPGRLPFWKGDQPGRPAELGAALGAWTREFGHLAVTDEPAARERLAAAGLDAWASDNLLAHLAEQREATGVVPDDRTVVVERFRDDVGDWRVAIHSPYGARVHAPWALVLAARLRERVGDVSALPADDGIMLRLPDPLEEGTYDVASGTWHHDAAPVIGLDDLLIDPDNVWDLVRDQLGGSALFAARFREAAARALLLPSRPDRRSPLWQQRLRASRLLEAAADQPDFPILLEAARECLTEDYDVAALVALMRDLAARRVRVVEVTTPVPSPAARALVFTYTARFLYEGDAPLAERRAATLALDPTLLSELLGRDGVTPLAELLEPEAVLAVEAEIGGLARPARDVEQVADVVRRFGPLTLAEVTERTADVDDAAALLALARARRVLELPAPVGTWWAVVEDAGRLRDALGTALPPGLPSACTDPVPDPLGDLVRRWARGHGPFAAATLAARFGLPEAAVTEVLTRLAGEGVVVRGALRPEVLGGTGDEWCAVDVLRLLRRRSLAALRQEVEAVPPVALGAFLPRWQGVVDLPVGGPDGTSAGSATSTGSGASASAATPAGPATPGRDDGRRARRGGSGTPRPVLPDDLLRVVEQLAGAVVPASALETLVLPARLPGYRPELLDELLTAGEVVWAGHGPLAARDGLVSLHPAATADLTLPPAGPGTVAGAPGVRSVSPVPTVVTRPGSADEPPTDELGADAASAPLTEHLHDLLSGGGAWFFDPLLARLPDAPAVSAVTDALWDLVWAGLVTNDSLAPLRARLGRGGTTHRAPRRPGGGRSLGPALRPTRPTPPEASGRWSLLPPREPDPTVRAHAAAAVLLDRHGVLTRGVGSVERAELGPVLRVLAALEEAGKVRRGYFVEHLGGSQYALPGAVDRLREVAGAVVPPPGDPAPTSPVVVLAATDPANPYGAALAWPETTGHRPGRKAGGLVVLVGGALTLYVERGGRTALTFDRPEPMLRAAVTALADTVRAGRLGAVSLHRADGAPLVDREALASDLGRALLGAGFTVTPSGVRLRPGGR